jgi:glycosyltransferase involved in cell wall biosynthesis
MKKEFRILLVVDPKVATEPLLPETLFNWSTVYSYSLIQAFKRLGNDVEIENVYEIIKGDCPRLGAKRFDFALVILNNASKDFGTELFDRIRDLIIPSGLIGTISDHDFGIEFEDVRFCATIINPREQSPRAHQVYWGCDPNFLEPEKDEDCLTILLDSWHLEDKKYDRTPEILHACLEYSKSSDNFIGDKGKIRILAWGNDGIEEFRPEGENELVRKPNRVGFGELMENLRRADVFMVTHSESMGLTILEAAMAGCVVVIPVPAIPNPDVSRWIREDLAETVPHVDFSHRLEERIEIPWNDIGNMMDPSKIRGETIEFTWERVAERIIEGWGIGAELCHPREENIRKGRREKSAFKANTNPKLREMMLISTEMAAWPENQEVRHEYCKKWGLDLQDI